MVNSGQLRVLMVLKCNVSSFLVTWMDQFLNCICFVGPFFGDSQLGNWWQGSIFSTPHQCWGDWGGILSGSEPVTFKNRAKAGSFLPLVGGFPNTFFVLFGHISSLRILMTRLFFRRNTYQLSIFPLFLHIPSVFFFGCCFHQPCRGNKVIEPIDSHAQTYVAKKMMEVADEKRPKFVINVGCKLPIFFFVSCILLAVASHMFEMLNQHVRDQVFLLFWIVRVAVIVMLIVVLLIFVLKLCEYKCVYCHGFWVFPNQDTCWQHVESWDGFGDHRIFKEVMPIVLVWQGTAVLTL